MIDRKRFLAKIRELGYTHQRTHGSNLLYRRRGRGHRDPMVVVPRRGNIDPEYAREVMAKSGCPDEEIESFLKDH